MLPHQQQNWLLSQAHASGLGIAHLALWFPLLWLFVTSLGGPIGPGLNPARDFGPRLVHAFLPKSVLGEHKGDLNGGMFGTSCSPNSCCYLSCIIVQSYLSSLIYLKRNSIFHRVRPFYCSLVNEKRKSLYLV